MIEKIKIDEYEILLEDNGKGEFYATRYGEPFRDLVGDGLTISLFTRIQELECEVLKLKNK